MTAFLIFIGQMKTTLDDPFSLFFLDLLIGFTLDTKGRHRTGFEPLDTYIFAAFLTNAVLAFVKSSQRLLNFEYQLSFAVADPQDGITVRFHSGPVTRIWKILIIIHILDGFTSLGSKLLHPLIEKIPEKFCFLLFHRLFYQTLT